MKITKTDMVYRDKLTDVWYTKEYAAMPIAVVTGPGPTSTFGVLLKPYAHHSTVTSENMDELLGMFNEQAKHGYLPAHSGQSILVSEDIFRTRFECLGRKAHEIDLAALVRQYEDESCSFDDKAKLAARLLNKADDGLDSARLYVLLKDYLEPQS